MKHTLRLNLQVMSEQVVFCVLALKVKHWHGLRRGQAAMLYSLNKHTDCFTHHKNACLFGKRKTKRMK